MPARLAISRLTAAAPRVPVTGVRRAVAAPSARRAYATEAGEDAPPPLLSKLKGDLKTAMRAKDKARLSVLRSVMAAALNASKTASPINTDAKVVELLRKTARSSQEAVDEAKAAGRADLAETELAQIQILEAYVNESGIESLSRADVETAVKDVLEQLAAETGAKAKAGDAIKKLLAPGGPLAGKDFNKAEMAQIVKQLTR